MNYFIYDLFHYDIWGSVRTGFEVNDVFCHTMEFQVPEDVLEYDSTLVAYLKKEGILDSKIRVSSIDVDGENEYTIYLTDIRSRAGGFKPLMEMRYIRTDWIPPELDEEFLTAEQIAEKTDDKEGLANIRAINKLYRLQDESHRFPILGKFNVTDRAIQRVRAMRMALYGLEYCYCLEAEISRIVNAE